ncbi:MAG: redox-regulated ATPase YchF [bacterium]|nr:redox-regulated ATPase YchF [bacterium]
MSLKVGIVGLPNVGKSTLFNALLKKQQAYVANFPFATIEPNIGIVPVPDPRLKELAEVVKESEKMDQLPPEVPAVVQFVDIAGLVAGAHKGEGLGNKFLSHIREVDAICYVIRAFSDPDIIREGSVDPKSDFEIVKTELDLSDYEMTEKSKIKNQNAKIQVKNQNDLPLFSKKPVLIVLNVDEEDLKNTSTIEHKYASELGVNEDQIVVISAKVESELAALSLEEQKAYLADLGIEESGLERLAKKAFATLGLITFLTAGIKEVRAWTIRLGATALMASGVIHTDFMDKFIKAEVVKFNDFVEVGGPVSPGERASRGGWKKAREMGKSRLEGRDYVMQDGDVVEFKIGA